MTNLNDHIVRLVRASGPISIAQYMELCLTHPEMGYYTTRDPLGAGGDFTTAPEISQMFGELIGLFFADYWFTMGSPAPARLIELGPGRGTLMADAIRVLDVVPDFKKAAEVHFIEVSPALKKLQQKAVPGAGFHESLEDVPEGPSFIIANEFFDVLPIRQFVWQGGGWSEKMVAERDGKLAFVLKDDFPPAAGLPRRADEGDTWETAPQAAFWISSIASRLKAMGGLALIIDYGYGEDAFGDSFQAVRKQKSVGVLDHPGEADLTAHVNFADLAAKAKAAGLAVFGPRPQGAFLDALGIGQRAQQLLKVADAKQKKDIEAAVKRLTSAKEMGQLFKVLCLGAKGAPAPAGFGDDG